MESYLVGEDLWDIVGGGKANAPEDITDDANVKKWVMTNAKEKFVLKRSISHDLFEHIMMCKSTSAIWETLGFFFNKNNVTRLQMLENDLANATQGDLPISKFFLKVKSLCSEISLLDLYEPILIHD